MNNFCLVRFEQDPMSDRIYAQGRMTWGEDIKHLYSDFWHWSQDIPHFMKKSVASPVVYGIISNV